MSEPLCLKVVEFQDETHWRWVLTDHRDNFIADNEVVLDRKDSCYRGFKNLPDYLRYHSIGKVEETLLTKVGVWISNKIFGNIVNALCDHIQYPATVVRVCVPLEAQELLFRPFELAHVDNKPFATKGIQFVYQLSDDCLRSSLKPIPDALRVLAIFSLPSETMPLDLRRERYELKQLFDMIRQTQGVRIELRIVQYGATRNGLRDVLLDARGWDMIHFSGHGQEGELLLEKDDGREDHITAEELLSLLRPTQSRLKLITLSACLSAAASLGAARAQLGFKVPPTSKKLAQTVFPSLGQNLARELDCAVIAMRYPVGDKFTICLMQSVYSLMLKHGQPLPSALQLTLQGSLGTAVEGKKPSTLSVTTPILFGPRAVKLALTAPKEKKLVIELPKTGLFKFPPEPSRFVGRLIPMLQASRALAPESSCRGVIFQGMPGAGKTTCAVELAYRHEQGRFAGFVWYSAPKENQDITTALWNFLHEIEVQLDMTGITLTAYVDNAEIFKERTLPRLKKMLSEHTILLVLDNIEGLLNSQGEWRDAIWGQLMRALLGHTGMSRIVLTSRHMPKSLEMHPQILRIPVHALSLGESMLLARELPNLSALADTAKGVKLLKRVLNVVQGHPKLLELSDKLAVHREVLEKQVLKSEKASADHVATLSAFFEIGESKQDESDFVAILKAWTSSISAALPSDARLLLYFLCRMEEGDRTVLAINATWKSFLDRLKDSFSGAAIALKEPKMFLDNSLRLLLESGLIECIGGPADDFIATTPSYEKFQTLAYDIHPCVAEAACAEAPSDVLKAVDLVMSHFNVTIMYSALEHEARGGCYLVAEGARHAIPYLKRVKFWKHIPEIIERMIMVDRSPAALNMAIPILRQMITSAEGAPEQIDIKVILAKALMDSCWYVEASRILVDALSEYEAKHNWIRASVVAGELINVLRDMGYLQEALAVAERKVNFTRKAGLGEWTQLADENWRLQILNRMERYDEVIERMKQLRLKIKTVPDKRDSSEVVTPWNVYETLLAIGVMAHIGLKQWQAVIDLSDEIIKSKRKRDAFELDIAESQLNFCAAFLHLDRKEEARTMLEYCRQVFEDSHAMDKLAKAYGTLAELEYNENHNKDAIKFETAALRLNYKICNPLFCAYSHNNLSLYLDGSESQNAEVTAHFLASKLISFRLGLAERVSRLSMSMALGLPSSPPSFEEVAKIVENIEGVNFRELFASLPEGESDGNVVLAKVWKSLQDEKPNILPPIALAWYHPSQWERLREVSTDVLDTYEEWSSVMEVQVKFLKQKGFRVQKVVIDVEELLRWCREQGKEVDSSARSEFAIRLAERSNE